MLDADLQQIRARFPQLQEVHAQRDTTMTELIIALDLDAPWLETWKAERLTTGDAAVDGLLQEFGVLTIRKLHEYTWAIQWKRGGSTTAPSF